MSASKVLLPLTVLALALGMGVWWLAREGSGVRPAEETPAVEILPGASARTATQPAAAVAADTPGETPSPPRDMVSAEVGGAEVDDFLSQGLRATTAVLPRSASAHGRLVDGKQEPVVGARVLASRAGTHAAALLDAPANAGKVRESRSDPDGRFELDALDTVALRLAVRADGFAPLDVGEQPLAPGDRLDLGELRLEPGVRLAGRVLDSEMRPVDAARIYLVSAPLFGPLHRLGALAASPLGQSDAAGRFELACIAPGAWTLLVQHAEFPQALFEGSNLPPDLSRNDLELILFPDAPVSGEVLEFDARATPDLEVVAVPAEGMALFATSKPAGATHEWLGGVRHADVDDFGRFVLRGLAPGTRLALRAQSQSQALSVQTLDLEDPWAPWLWCQAGAVDLRLEYLRGARLEFEVVSRTTGQPIERLRARLEGLLPATAVDAQGHERSQFPGGRVVLSDLRAAGARSGLDEFSGAQSQAFAKLRARGAGSPSDSDPACEFKLRLEAPGFDVLEFAGLRLAPQGSLNLGSVSLTALPILEFRVVDAATQAAIAGARVQLSAARPGLTVGRTHSAATSAGDGLARLTSLSDPIADLTVSCEGFESLRMPVPPGLKPGGPPWVVELSRGAQVVVIVRDAHGALAPAARVRLARVGWDREGSSDGFSWNATRTADAQGVALFRDVPRGEFNLWAQRVDGLGLSTLGNAVARSIVVQGGERLEVSVEVSSLSELSGDVWFGQEALAGATLSFEPGRGGFADLGANMQEFSQAPGLRTDEQGHFAGVELAPGEYSLLIVHEALGVNTRREIRVEERETRVILDIDDTAISGHVFDSRGQPVAGASVELFADLRTWREDLRSEPGDRLLPYSDRRRPVSATRTEADGSYRLRAVPPGAALQMVFALGSRADARPRIRVSAGRTLESIDGALPEAGSLRVQLSAPRPDPDQHYGVRIVGLKQPPGLSLQAGYFDEQNSAYFDELPPGPWRVMVFALDSADVIVEAREAQTVQVQAGKEIEFSVGW